MKLCCRGRNACKRQRGCKTDPSASCAGQNDCKGKRHVLPEGLRPYFPAPASALPNVFGWKLNG